MEEDAGIGNMKLIIRAPEIYAEYQTSSKTLEINLQSDAFGGLCGEMTVILKWMRTFLTAKKL